MAAPKWIPNRQPMGAVRVRGEVRKIGSRKEGTGYPAIVGDQKAFAVGDYEMLTREVIDDE